MKKFLRLSAFLFTFMGFANFLHAQDCPMMVTRNCEGAGNTVSFDLDIELCSQTPDASQVVYMEVVPGTPPTTLNYSYGTQLPCNAANETAAPPISVSYTSTAVCNSGNPFSLTFNFGNNDGPSGVVCEYDSDGIILPVELVYFSSKIIKESVLLEWQTATEINNEGFFVEHSIDGKEWITLGFIEGNGNSEELINYDFMDRSPVKGDNNYYRLRQLDFDGREEIHRVATEFVPGEGAGQINIFPNPVSKGEVNVEFHFEDTQETIVRLVDALGRTVLMQEILVTDKEQRNALNLSKVSKGNYYLIVQTQFQTYHKQLVIQ